MYERNQKQEVLKLRKQWSDDASTMMRAEAMDRNLLGLQGLTLTLQNMEIQDE